MKKEKIKNLRHLHVDGKHSFLFWLIVPIAMVWLTIGYIRGITVDNPIWLNSQSVSKNVNQVIPYYQQHGNFSQNLDQPFITLWFDDAWSSQYLTAYPILKKNEMPGTIAIAVNAVETSNYMNWAQLNILQKNGWETTDHSLEHNCAMQKWSTDQIIREYKNSKFIIWKNGLSADIFVTPCGVDSKVMREEASKMFMGYRTVDPGFNDPKNFDFYNLKVKNIDNKTTFQLVKSWIEQAKKDKLWLILVFHKVGEKSVATKDDDYNTPKAELEEIVNYIKSANIKVVVPSQIMASQNL